VVLTPLVAAAGLAWTIVACSSPPSPPSPAAEATVVASWIANDGSIVVLNVIVGPDTDRRRLPDLARELRGAHPEARVIVTVFDDAAGPERYLIGRVPAGDEPLVFAPRGPGRLATFDFPRPPPASGRGRGPCWLRASDPPLERVVRHAPCPSDGREPSIPPRRASAASHMID